MKDLKELFSKRLLANFSRGFFALLFASVGLLFGCASFGGGLGDGKVDILESIGVMAITEGVLAAKPEYTEPAYLVSTAMIERLNGNDTTPLTDFDSVIKAEAEKLNLSEYSTQMFIAMSADIRAEILKRIGETGEIPIEQRTVAMLDILKIIQGVSGSRLGVK